MASMTTFHEVDRKQAFGGFAQEVILEPSKQYPDLELYLDDLVEYLHPQMHKMLQSKGRGIIFWWSVQVKYSPQLMMTVDYDDEDNLFPSHDDEDHDDDDDDEDVSPVYLHSGRTQIPNREQMGARMAEARHIILERNSGSIWGNSNVVIDSIGDVCFKVINNSKLKWTHNNIRQGGRSRDLSSTSHKGIRWHHLLLCDVLIFVFAIVDMFSIIKIP